MFKKEWISKNFNNNNGFLTYENKFVARFKYKVSAVNDFKKFLVSNFSPTEYFARLDAKEAPLNILESKGYILPHIRKWLAQAGLPSTQEGYQIFKQRNLELITKGN